MSNLQVAETIRQQIMAGTVSGKGKPIGGKQASWCWGMTKMLAREINDQPALSFSVSGLAFVGKVAVVLTTLDDYTILSYEKGQTDWDEVADGVQCEELAQFLDIFIEGRK